MFATNGLITRGAGDVGLSALPLVFWRGVASTVLMIGALSVVAARGDGAGGGLIPRLRAMPLGGRRALAIGALLGAAVNVAMFLAFSRTAIAVALICFYIFPALVAVGAVPLYGDRLGPRRVVALILSSGGLLLVLLAPAVSAGSSLVIDSIGVALALGAAVCQATFLLVAGRGFAPLRPVDVATVLIASVAPVAAALMLVGGQITAVATSVADPRAWFWIVATATIGAAIPTTMFLTGLFRVGPSRAAILMTFEPVVGVTLAALLLGERPVPLQIVGGAAVVIAAALLQAQQRVEPPVV